MRARLRWRCRRGMKELDVLLGRFLEHRYDEVDETHQAAFAALLEQQDPSIADLLLGRVPPPEGPLGRVIEMIRADSGIE